MRGIQTRHGWFSLVIVVTALVLAAPPARAQKKVSAKDLVRQAEEDQKANRWEAAWDKLKNAAEQKPKDKKIAQALKDVENYLADSVAVRAIGLCDQKEIDKCEKEVKLAASYANTQRVQEAQAKLAARKKEVQDHWAKIQQMINGGQLNDAAAELENLNRFSYLLPGLAAEKDRVRGLRVKALIEQGGREVAAQKFDSAIDAYSNAARLDPNNSEAPRGIENAKKEKEAYTAFMQAQNAYRSKGYQVAYDANQKALRLYPARAQYQELARQIGEEWIKILVDEAKKLSSNPDNLKDNQQALEKLEMARRLNPREATLATELPVVRNALFSMYLQKAGEYQAIPDNSRIGLAYLFYLSAQQTNPAGGEFAFSAKLKEAGSIFTRKRTVQVLVNVNNLSPAPATFTEPLGRRMRAVIDNLGLPDVKIRTPDEYEKNPGEDPQFVENRPDGKSPTVILTASLSNHESEMTGGDKPIEKKSTYIAGQELVPNPTYEKVQADYRKVHAALLRDKPKPNKATREGYTYDDQTLLQQQMATTPREVPRDRISEYSYQEYQLKVRAAIRMTVEARDYLEKQLLGSEPIEVSDEKSQVEVTGVRDRDQNNLMNKTARLPSPEQLLREAERNTLQQLDDKVKRLITSYLQRFYAEGEKALREGRNEDALENFLCHWYLSRGRMEENQARRIRDLVKLGTGLDLSTTGTLPTAGL